MALRNVGRAIQRAGATRAGRYTKTGLFGMAATGIVGAGWMGGTVAGMVTNEEKDTPVTDWLFEMATGNAQLDRAVLGQDVGLGALYPMPFDVRPSSLKRLGYVNPQTFQDLEYMDTQTFNRPDGSTYTAQPYEVRVARDAASNGYIDHSYPQMTTPYRPRVSRRNTNASGDIVFGSYNLRHGS